ncbi:MAG: methionine--tRNA ligase [Elusimicrobia bacterium]|nr:methionine--tRNA ligase [Elusimicrobiota bacterium]
MSKKFYITTPLYYLSGTAHIGHAYTTLAADVIARYQKGKGRQVHFLTGSDEHGANIEKVSAQVGKTPAQWTDELADSWQKLWASLEVQHSDFIRTTEPRHEKPVQRVFEILLEKGDIYKGSYEGWYCTPCENYLDPAELVNGKCPLHDCKAEQAREETYFFRLSKYQQALLDHYEKNPEFLSPKSRSREIINFVKSGLQDTSISRSKVSWGIPIPGDPKKTIYVWFDALLNYATAVGLAEKLGLPEGGALSRGRKFDEFWPADIHLVGKEIYRFHAVLWPAMLMALGLPLPKKVFAHGWWTVNGEKMSKTRGNVVNPEDYAREYGVDALRYFVFREVPFGNDGDFSDAAFAQRYNSELANSLGNLLSRTLNMVDKYIGGKLPGDDYKGGELYAALAAHGPAIDAHMEALELDKALDRIWCAVAEMNQAIDRNKPWVMAKENPAGLEPFLLELSAGLRLVSGWLEPFMPETAGKMRAQLTAPRKTGEKMAPLFPRKEAAKPAK